MKSVFVSVIIPAYNEEEYIEKTIHHVMKLPYSKEVIVIDDGSIDRTKEIVTRLHHFYEKGDFYFISSEKNNGKGKALARGIKQAKGEILLFLDADLGETAHYAINLIQPLLHSDCDMCVAIFPKVKIKSGFGLVKRIAQCGIYYYTGFKSLAPLSGQRAVKRHVLSTIKNLNNGFGIEVGLTIDALNQGYRLKEIEIPFSHRVTERNLSGFFHRGKEFLDVLITLLLKWRITE